MAQAHPTMVAKKIMARTSLPPRRLGFLLPSLTLVTFVCVRWGEYSWGRGVAHPPCLASGETSAPRCKRWAERKAFKRDFSTRLVLRRRLSLYSSTRSPRRGPQGAQPHCAEHFSLMSPQAVGGLGQQALRCSRSRSRRRPLHSHHLLNLLSLTSKRLGWRHPTRAAAMIT